MDGLLDEWMIGFEFKITQKSWRYTRIIRKAFRIIYLGCFWSYVFDTQPSINPVIQSSMGRQWNLFVLM
ncbi:MAG TPA: hypothetical protein DET40_16880 [Lentisphaeria bacterium]|nr:hypothetical protein [Lentisphaeria bacterium]